MIIEFSSIIKPTPAASTDHNGCIAGTEFDLDVCHASETSTLIDGTVTNCTTGDDRIAMYLSTAATATNGGGGNNPFEAPTSSSDAAHGFNLGSALTVTASSSGTFVVNGAGKIEEQGSGPYSCEFQPPLFSFR